MTAFLRRRSLAALAFAALGPAAAAAQAPTSPILDAVEVRRLVASTAIADQATLAAHFAALADRAADDARRHEAMGQAAPGGPRVHAGDWRSHCARLARLGRDAETTLRELAAHHATLAGGAASVAPARGARYQAGAGARAPEVGDMAALAARPATPEKHRALQDYFEAFAKRYAEQAAGHVAMGAHYRTTKSLAPVAAHCDRLVEQWRAIEAEARQAAAMHEALANRK
jgi:hypothetical protein